MLVYYNAAENPIRLWCRDPSLTANSSLIDFSVGSWSFVFKLGTPGSAAALTKSSGIVGAAGAGQEPTGTPNVVITPTTDEFASLAGLYTYQLRATSAGADEFFQGDILIKPVVT